MDIAKLRSALGIDDLMSSLKTAGAQTETPEFKMPEFEMPQFEAPDWQSMMPDFESLIKQYMPQQSTEGTGEGSTTGEQTTGTQPAAATPRPAGTKVNVGGKTYNLSRAGGAGLGGQDIKNMQRLGFTKSQISKAATQATTAGARISKGAQSLLGKMQPAKKQPSTQARSTAKTMTGSARQAISRTAARPAARPAASKASRGKK
jgi:hypothetical protein